MRLCYVFLFCFSLLFSQEKIIAGIAITVNGDPITLNEIAKTQKDKKMEKKQAIDFLISQKLKNQEIKRLKIDASDSRIENEILDLAHRNGLSKEDFLRNIKKQEGLSPKAFAKKLKEQIQTQDLIRNILSTNSAGEEEMREYYHQHQDEFNIPKEVAVLAPKISIVCKRP